MIYVDDDAGTSLTFQSDSSGYEQISMSDGKNTVTMKLTSAMADILVPSIMYSNAIRKKIPQS